MITRITALLALLASVALFAPLPAHAQKFEPGSVYICPNQSATGLDCYLDAVVHLYTMCRHVKSIEIIEFGHAKAQEGVNGAKSEYCVDKQKINITRPYQAALREGHRMARRRGAPARASAVLARCHGQPAVAGRSAAGLRGPRHQGVRRPVVEDRRGSRVVHHCARRRRERTRRGGKGESPSESKAATRRTSVELATSDPEIEHDDAGHDDALDAIFREGGTLSRALPAFRFRSQQLEMAQAIARAIASHTQLVAEAGTGTGKTFAYLVPRCSTAARSSSPPEPRRCRTSSSSATCRWCATRSRLRDGRAAQGARELRLPLSPRARGARGPPAFARRRAPPAQDRRLSRAHRSEATARSFPTCRRTRASGRS
jgi:hypothetical protein